MAEKSSFPQLSGLAQTDPGLGILRHAALLAESEAAPEAEELDLLFSQTDAGFLLDLAPLALWTEFSRGLMGAKPGKMLLVLRECGALAQILPEVDALFGVPILSDQPTEVDLGAHVPASLDEAATAGASLAARFALLVMHVGKADSPKIHLPVHYRHLERAAPRIKTIFARLGGPADGEALALAALHEVERIHRVSKMRAGPVALMLERLGAFDRADFYADLLAVATADFRAFPGRSGQIYPKAELLELARKACVGVVGVDDEILAQQRALAISRAFHSQRWEGEA